MFAYCLNNPVNMIDIAGDWPSLTSFFTAIAVVAAVVAVAAVCVATAGTAVVAGGAIVSSVAATTAVEVATVATEVAVVSSGIATISATVEVIDTTTYYPAFTPVIESKQETIVYSKTDPDPYKREGQKKQGRENKNKSRKKENFRPRNNRRDGKPAKPKHHTPGRDHRKFDIY